MKLSQIAFVLMITLGMSQTADAQFFKKLGEKIEKRAERKLEERLERKADKAMDRTLDTVTGTEQGAAKRRARRKVRRAEKRREQESNGNSGAGMLEAMMNGGGDVNVRDSYELDMTITLSVDDGRGEPQVVKQAYGDGMIYMDHQAGSVLIDADNEAMITITEDSKSMTVMSMAMMKAFMPKDASPEYDEDDYTIKKTGRTKTIAGYRCEEMLISYPEGKAIGWFTDKVKVDTSAFSKMFMQNADASVQLNAQLNNGGMGYMMEMTTDVDGSEIHMEVIEVSKQKRTINTSDYSVTKM